MIQSQYKRKQSISIRDRSTLLKHHPVLLPVALLSCSLILANTAFSAENIFPVLTLLGVPSIPLCLSIALVLGISGILTSIIGIIEYIDGHSVKAAMFPKSKEQKP
jgi:anaerobic C4-dicarboxylate transporter